MGIFTFKVMDGAATRIWSEWLEKLMSVFRFSIAQFDETSN